MKWLAEAPFLTRERLIVYPRAILAVFALAAVGYILASDGITDPWGRPIGTDFISFWTGSQLILSGSPDAVYDMRHFLAQRALMGAGYSDFNSWHYPPVFHFLTWFLSLLPYALSLLLWVSVPLVLYLVAIWRIVPHRDALWLALAFPAVLVNLGHGQTGFLVAALLGWAMLLLDRRPWLAGLLVALLTCKPQYGVLLPLFLLITGRWQVFAAAALASLALVGASIGVFGLETWSAFLSKMPYVGEVLSAGLGGHEKMPTVYAATRHAGLPLWSAATVHTLVALGATAAAVWVWCQPAARALHAAALVGATLLISPYVLDYDLMLLAFPVAWLAREGLRTGFLRFEKAVLLAVWILPLLTRTVAQYTYLPLGPAVLILLFAIVVRRAAATATGTAASPVAETGAVGRAPA